MSFQVALKHLYCEPSIDNNKIVKIIYAYQPFIVVQLRWKSELSLETQCYIHTTCVQLATANIHAYVIL